MSRRAVWDMSTPNELTLPAARRRRTQAARRARRARALAQRGGGAERARPRRRAAAAPAGRRRAERERGRVERLRGRSRRAARRRRHDVGPVRKAHRAVAQRERAAPRVRRRRWRRDGPRHLHRRSRRPPRHADCGSRVRRGARGGRLPLLRGVLGAAATRADVLFAVCRLSVGSVLKARKKKNATRHAQHAPAEQKPAACAIELPTEHTAAVCGAPRAMCRRWVVGCTSICHRGLSSKRPPILGTVVSSCSLLLLSGRPITGPP